MPTAQFEARDASGNLQASADAFTYSLHSSGTINFSSGTTTVLNDGAKYYRKTLVVSEPDLIVAIKPTTQYGGVERYYTFSGTTYIVFVADSTSASIPYKLFTTNLTHTDTGIGLELRDENGDVTFTSSAQPIQIHGLHTFPTNWCDGASIAITGIQDRYIWISNSVIGAAIGTIGFPSSYQVFYPMVKVGTNILYASGSGYIPRTNSTYAASDQGVLTVASVT